MKIIIFSIFFVLVLVRAQVKFDNPFVSKTKWTSFRSLHKKGYKNVEVEQEAYKVFSKNVQAITEHNAKFNKGLVSFKMAVNRFADMTIEKILETMTGAKPENATRSNVKSHAVNLLAKLPDTVDWRTNGTLSPVKNQKSCGSCWAFAALVPMEFQVALNENAIQDYSEEQLVDCVYFLRPGCWGGWMSDAYDHIKKQGIQSEVTNPYKGSISLFCGAKSTFSAICTGYKSVKTEDALKDAVANVGPVAVAICVNKSFVQYSSGIFDDPIFCWQANHAVVVVGYGTEDGKDYWLVQNSWGTDWGDKGYIKMARNKNNQRLIASYGIYPTGCKKLS